jgi:hypothetical protein
LGIVYPSKKPLGIAVFWRRDKKVTVELLTPVNFNLSIPPSKIVDHDEPRAKEVDTELTFKLLTYFVVAVQASLIIYGYLELAAYYEQFGILTSELELGIPTLLLYGYSYSFSSLMGTVDRVPLLGPFIPGLVFVGIAFSFAYVLMHRLAKVGAILERGTWGGMLLFLLFAAPALGVWHGVERGRGDIQADTEIPTHFGVGKEHSVLTDRGESLSGRLVVADVKSTFLLVGNSVYKLDNTSNRVVRTVQLRGKPNNRGGSEGQHR